MEKVKNEEINSHVTLTVQREHQGDLVFKVRRSLPLRTVLVSYCDKLGLDYRAIRFTFDGKRVKGSKAADDMELQDGDSIDAWSDQFGGAAVVLLSD